MTLPIQTVLDQFAVFAGIAEETPENAAALCAHAAAEIGARADPEKTGGTAELCAAAAALAYYRFVLAALSGGSAARVGHVAMETPDTARAALALLEQYLAAASGWLVPRGFVFRQSGEAQP